MAKAVTTTTPPAAMKSGVRAPCEALALLVAGKEVDGAHRSSPRSRGRLRSTSEPACVSSGTLRPSFTRRNGIAEPDRCADLPSDRVASPGMCAVPPVRTISPIPSAPG